MSPWSNKRAVAFEFVTLLTANGDLVPESGDLHISSWN